MEIFPSWLGPDPATTEFQEVPEIVNSFVHVFNLSTCGSPDTLEIFNSFVHVGKSAELKIRKFRRIEFSLGKTSIGATWDIPKLLRTEFGSKDLVDLVFPDNFRISQVAQNANET